MGYKIENITDHIIGIDFLGDFTAEDALNHAKEMDPILDQFSLTGHQAQFLIRTASLGKISLEGRRSFAERNGDPRVGKTAVVGVNRLLKIVAQFVTVASGKNNIRFFDDEENAIKWLGNSD